MRRIKRARLIPKEKKIKTFLELPEKTKGRFKVWCHARGITFTKGMAEAMRFCIKECYVSNCKFFNRNGE